MSIIHQNELPDFITAGSPRGLRRLMYKTNARFGGRFLYFDMSHFVDLNGKLVFIAWYYRKFDNLDGLDGDT